MEYASGKWLEEVTPSHPPRLFQCSNASGRFNVEEVFDFAQEVSLQYMSKPQANTWPVLLTCQQDLDESDVMILDTYSQVFVWVGREAREDEVKEALKITVEYVRTDPSNRDLASTELLQVCEVASYPHSLGMRIVCNLPISFSSPLSSPSALISYLHR